MEDQLTLFEKIRTDLVDQEELVSTGKMMSTEAIKYDRSVFAFISKSGNMVFKFGKDFNPDEQDYEVIPFNPFKNKGPLTGWYEVPYTHSDLWEFLTKEALIKIKQKLGFTMALNQEYVDYIMDQLAEFDGASSRKMFGGVGIFKDGIMFAMVTSENRFFLKVDKDLIPKFEEAGMEAFNHAKKGKGMPYWSAPAHVIEDKQLMKQWAEESFDVALKSKKK